VSCFERGEKVVWVSPVSRDQSYAIFMKHDTRGFPTRDAILLIGIGPKGNKMRHYFRWPLRDIRKLRKEKVGRTITRRND